MHYFMMAYSRDKKTIGFMPQVSSGDPAIAWSDPNYIEHFKINRAPDTALVPRPILHKTAKLTDLLSASLMGLTFSTLVSRKLKDLLLSGKSYGVQSFESMVIANGINHPYNLIHFYEFGWQFIDFRASEIVVVDDVDYSETPLKVTTKEEIISLIDNQNTANGGRYFYKIAKPVFLPQLSIDFFQLRGIYGGSGIFVSEKIKSIIENAGCTGIEFLEM